MQVMLAACGEMEMKFKALVLYRSHFAVCVKVEVAVATRWVLARDITKVKVREEDLIPLDCLVER